MPYARALRWLNDARGEAAWGYLPGGSPRGEPTVWACAAGASPPLPWLATGDLEWAILPAAAALSLSSGTEALRAGWLDTLLGLDPPSMSGQTLDVGEHVDGFIQGWAWFPETFSWVEPTCFALLSLARNGRTDHPRYAEGVRLLEDRVCRDGGWNYGNDEVLGSDLPSYPHSSAWAVLALPRGHHLVPAGLKRLTGLLERPSTRSLALAALASGHHGADPGPYIEPLLARQAEDGSFGLGRVDRTALAATALRMVSERTTPLTGPVTLPTPPTEEPADG
ncbi:MAG: hypothetical protein ACI8PZ_001033 [Myxococcota bacterium]|jgi:hypothetical protein